MLAPAELVCAADDPLYEAKHAGRDTWRYAAGLGETVVMPGLPVEAPVLPVVADTPCTLVKQPLVR
jgi:hypothetical protein